MKKPKFPRFIFASVLLYALILFVIAVAYNREQIANMMLSFYLSSLGKGAAVLVAITMTVSFKFMQSICGISFYKGKKEDEEDEEDEEE